MLNVIWPIFIILSIIYGIISGNIENINSSIFESCKSAVELSITFLGTMCLWNGIIKIAENSSIIEKMKKILKPLMKILFPNINENMSEYDDITMNMIANVLGLGNAATPLGINAMKKMQEKNLNKNEVTEEMAMFIIINTASIQLIPTTIIAIRDSLGSENPAQIIIGVWIVTLCAGIASISATKIFAKIYNKKKHL